VQRLGCSYLAAGRNVRLLELPRELRGLDTYVVVPASADASFAASELFARFGKNGRCKIPAGTPSAVWKEPA
jgi:hypothetical protein